MPNQKAQNFTNETINLNTQCKVVIYPWNAVLDDPDISDSELAKAGRLDISSQVQSVSFSKNMGSAAGSFSFTLVNSPDIAGTSNDWKDIIKRGYWCIIYMTQDGDLSVSQSVSPSKPKKSEAKKIRCIGYIERVGVTASTLENRSLDVAFTVSGRDFGVIYEETNIWHNLFKFDKIMLDSIAQTKLNVAGNVRIHDALKLIHDIFYFPLNIPGAKVNNDNSLLSIGLQWLLPKEMLIDAGFDLSGLAKGTYWGALPGITNFSPTGAGIAVDKPGDYLSGNAWEQLRRLSIPPYHELFCETTDLGLPQLTFRPIPWGIDQSAYPNNAANIQLYRTLKPVVTVQAASLYDFDLGEDDHSRYNSFLATVSTTMINTEDNISLLLVKDFPRQNSASIRRHGFRPMHVTVDSIVKNQELGNGSADQKQLIEFNEILYDYWNPAVFGESGTVSMAGNNLTKIGKVMKFGSGVPYLSSKRYYIEGYTDTFTFDDNRVGSWNQSVSLTRGYEEADLKAKIGFANRNAPLVGVGEFTKANPGTSK